VCLDLDDPQEKADQLSHHAGKMVEVEVCMPLAVGKISGQRHVRTVLACDTVTLRAHASGQHLICAPCDLSLVNTNMGVCILQGRIC
jgi:hypothetical protein